MASRNCPNASRDMSAYVDGRLQEDRRQEVARHLLECAECNRRADQMLELRRAMRSLPRVQAPPILNARLRVVASREIARHSRKRSLGALVTEWVSSVNLWLSNLMYPMALPFAGGIASAVMLFAVLVTSVVVPQSLLRGDDVPTAFSTEASVRSLGPLSYTGDVEVEVVIDGEGRVLDYTLPASVMANAELRRTVESNLIVTRFNPATTFGYPITGKVKLSFRKSHIEVKG